MKSEIMILVVLLLGVSGVCFAEAPFVDAGIAQQVLGTTATLNGLATDDGLPDPPGALTYQWTKTYGEPNVVFVDETDPQTDVTLVDGQGIVYLQLEADDGQVTTTDTTTVRFLPSWYNQIESTTISDYSGYVSEDYLPGHVVNGNGLDTVTGYHAIDDMHDISWSSALELVNQQYLTFDLGGPTDLNGARVWNISYPEHVAYGVETMRILVSADGSTWLSLGVYTIPESQTFYGDHSVILPLSPTVYPRYVKFEMLTNYRGTATDYVQLGEVRFSGYQNQAPQVDAGQDQQVWLQDGTVTVSLDAMVTDDGFLSSVVTLKWSKTSGPESYTFAPGSTVEDPWVTITEVGTYVFSLEADDSLSSSSDDVIVVVYANGCEHAKAQPGYSVPGDLSGDCLVDLDDFALFAENWLSCNSSDPVECD